MNQLYQVRLERKLGVFTSTNVIKASMIGTGIFTTSGFLKNDLNNPILMIALWISSGILALCGALRYGKLRDTIPTADGEYVCLAELFNRYSDSSVVGYYLS